MLHRRINISFELIIYSIQLNAIVSFSERRFTESLSQGFFGGSLTVDSDGKSELNTSGICRIPGTGLPEEINSTTSSKLGPLMSPSGTISSPTPGAAICWNHGREGSGSLSAIRGELFSIASGTELRSPCSFHILNLAESIGVTRLMFVSDCPFEKYTWRSRNTCTCQEVPDLQENQLHYSSAPKLSSTRSDRVSTRATERCLKYLESCIILPVILLKLLVDFISHPRISHPIEIPTVKLNITPNDWSPANPANSNSNFSKTLSPSWIGAKRSLWTLLSRWWMIKLITKWEGTFVSLYFCILVCSCWGRICWSVQRHSHGIPLPILWDWTRIVRLFLS